MAVLVRGAEMVERHWPRAGTLTSGLALAVTPLYADALGQTATTLIVVMGVILGTVTVIIDGRRMRRLRRQLGRARANLLAARSAGAANQVAIFDRLLPRAVERLNDLYRADDVERHAAHRALVAGVVGLLQGYLQEDDVPVLVNYYRLDCAATGPLLTVLERTGSVSRQVLDESTPDGRLILERVLGGIDVYCDDLSEPDQIEAHVRERDRERKYRCFASVVVRSDRSGYGMLSANTPVAGGLPSQTVSFMSVLGAILALGEEIVADVEPTRIAERTVLEPDARRRESGIVRTTENEE